jgi:hypothetical protein
VREGEKEDGGCSFAMAEAVGHSIISLSFGCCRNDVATLLAMLSNFILVALAIYIHQANDGRVSGLVLLAASTVDSTLSCVVPE